MIDKQEFLNLLRTELPRLLKDDPDFRAKVLGVVSETMGTKAEFNALLQELREMRAESNRRFEEMRVESDKRFEEMNRRFEEMRAESNKRFEQVDRRLNQIDIKLDQVDKRLNQVDIRLDQVDKRLNQVDGKLDRTSMEVNKLTIGLGSLGTRTGRAMEDVIRQVIEGYSGIKKLKAERLVLKDTEGELFGIKGADVEFDAYVTNGKKFLVEVKSYTKEDDVFNFHRKAEFAERRLGKVEKVIITPAIEKSAIKRCKELSIKTHAFSVVD